MRRSATLGPALCMLAMALPPLAAHANPNPSPAPFISEEGCGSANRAYILREGKDLISTNECGERSKVKLEIRTSILRYEPTAGIISQARRDKKTNSIAIYHSNGDTWTNGPNR